MDTVLYWIKRLLPNNLIDFLRPTYHRCLAVIGSRLYGNPSKEIFVIAVTGTKGKSTVTELVRNILAEDNKKVASLSTIQFRIGEKTKPNLLKMTTPGRFFIQRFLREAVSEGCTHAVLELTSEAAKQYRHNFLELDALIFTNLSPEHIESHGSFENYKNAKLSIAKQLENSCKQPRYMVANTDNEHGNDFLSIKVEELLPYKLSDLTLYTLHKDSISLVLPLGNKETTIRVPLIGLFNVYNSLAAITLTRAMGVPIETIEKALREMPTIRGRVEIIKSDEKKGKKITAVVDYAHTPDSLEKLYQAFPCVYKIGVLGNAGGGRDTWKRPEMGEIADRYCDEIILTNEDPYDEDPRSIVEAMAKGVKNKTKLEIIMDRRLAINTALKRCRKDGYVIISGKGTDPFIMGANNHKEPWDDAKVVREEMKVLDI